MGSFQSGGLGSGQRNDYFRRAGKNPTKWIVTEATKTDPDICLLGFSLWINGRESPDATDFWGSNWLMIRAEMRASGAYVEIAGLILTTADIEKFRNDLLQMANTLTGEAALTAMEPGLGLRLKMQKLGRVKAVVEITPDHLTQQHSFEVEADQSFLPGLVASCEAVLKRFPVINMPSK